MSLYDEFFEEKKDLLSQMRLFDDHYGFGLLAKLRKETNRTDFLSTITEINFGLFFDTVSSRLKYNHLIFLGLKLRPDWTIKMREQTIIAEALRLNATAADQCFIDFDTALMNELERIRLPYVLKLNYETEEFDILAFDLPLFRAGVETWLLTNPCIDDIYLFSHGHVEVVHTDGLTEKRVGLMGGFRSIDHKPQRLMSDKGRLMEKVNKYGPVAAMHNLPFIICIYVHFESWLKPKDIYKGLYGLATTVMTGMSCDGRVEGIIHHDLTAGLFYSNPEMKKNVSGILVRENDNHYYFHNHFHLNRLTDENAARLKLSCKEFSFPR